MSVIIENAVSRRTLFKLAGAGTGTAVLTATNLESALAQAPWVRFDNHSDPNPFPVGPEGQRSIFKPVIDAGSTMVLTGGDMGIGPDATGNTINTVGRDQGRQSRGTVLIIKGPSGEGKGGIIPINLLNKFNWFGVTPNPNFKPALSGSETAQLINMMLQSFRSQTGGTLTGPIDILVIDGKNAIIKEQRVVFPGQWVADDDPAHQ